jgi:hypothetical protein
LTDRPAETDFGVPIVIGDPGHECRKVETRRTLQLDIDAAALFADIDFLIQAHHCPIFDGHLQNTPYLKFR